MLAMQYSLGTSGWLRWSPWVKEAARDVHLCLDALREHHITSSWWVGSLDGVPFPIPLLSLSPPTAPKIFADVPYPQVKLGVVYSYSLCLPSTLIPARLLPHLITGTIVRPTWVTRTSLWAPEREQQRGQFESAPIHSLLPQFLWTLFQFWDQQATGQNGEQSTAEVLLNTRQIPASDLLYHLSHGLSCNWPWPSAHIPEKPLRAKSMVLTVRLGPV